MTYVRRTKQDVMKTRANTVREEWAEVELACGHQAEGSPTLANPARYWCAVCRCFSGVKGTRKAA